MLTPVADAMPRVERLTAFPVKSLDGSDRERIRLDAGGIVGDRSYALFEADADPETASVAGGGYVNGKSERRVHAIRATHETAGPADATPTEVTVRTAERAVTDDAAPDVPARGPATFALPDDGDALGEWLADAVGTPVRVERDAAGFPDDTDARETIVGPRATLAEVAAWFDGVDAEGMRRRLRANVVVGGVPAFWEDRLFADRGSRVRFRIGEVVLEGVTPCQRCVVPSRDPDTGVALPGFRETFLDRRRETMPEWSGGDRFDHDFRLMVNTAIPEAARGGEIAVGDGIEILETVPTAE